MRVVARHGFASVKTEGAILPADLLQRIADGAAEGTAPADYHLAPNEKLNEAINRAWNRCLGAWAAFSRERERLPSTDAGTTLTRERWLLILFQELGYGRLQLARGLEADGQSYPISHLWGHTPIHLVSFRQGLDNRGELPGATRRSPHSLMQEFLNRSPAHLWGIISNGLRLRLLRDNASLTRAAYVEFDLEAMMDGELYADFSLLWLVCHQSRVEGERPGDCWLERWSRSAAEQGTRALDALRDGVQEAIAALGRGFLAHRANGALKAQLKSGELTVQGYYRELLRLVYQLIFLLVAEERDLLLAPDAPPEAKRRYLDHYSLRRLRHLAEGLRGGPHADLYRGLRLVLRLLREGYPPLALPALGSSLFSERATPHLEGAELANAALLEAVRALAFTLDGGVRRPVDYRNLGSEELGSVYESLLELQPELNVDSATFELKLAAGSERKTTGSYYTPTSLVNCLLDSALEPVVADRLAKARQAQRAIGDAKDGRDKGSARSRAREPRPSLPDSSPLEQAILSIKVVDPACGSGHFLIAAAHRLARHLARVRTGEEEPPPTELRAALRQVVSSCIYGVDVNEMAVELCKVGLWLETLDPGKPLSFLDANIQCGNSLIGATPALLRQGIPDEAFTPIEGDDKAYCAEWKKRNHKERQQTATLFDIYTMRPWERLGDVAAAMMGLAGIGDDTIEGVRHKQELYESLVRSGSYRYGRLWADAWCAAFLWKKTKEFAYPITEGVFRKIERNPHDLAKWMEEEVQRLAGQYRFFHWHLAFPQVFRVPGRGEEPESEQTGWSGGFDVVLGNPPWERVKLQEKEWFAARRPDIAGAPNAARRRQLIEALAKEDPALHAAFLEARRQAEGESQFVRITGRYPLCGRGDVNTYAVFAELARSLIRPDGRAGIIVPSGIATDDTTRFFFQDVMDARALASLYDFENRNGLFPGVHRSYKFCLLTLAGPARPAARGAEFVFFAHTVDDLQERERRITLTAADIALLNPNTRTCPIFRTRRDAELTKAIYRRVPVLIREGPPEENPWGVSFLRMFDMSNDSHLFRTRQELEAEGWVLEGNVFVKRPGPNGRARRYLPLYEAKMIHQFDHRWATYDGPDARDVTLAEKQDPSFSPLPRYWVAEADVLAALPSPAGRAPGWLFGFRDITNTTNERTAIFALMPWAAVGNNAPLALVARGGPQEVAVLSASLASHAFDFVARLKVGGTHLNFFIVEQLPVLPPAVFRAGCSWHPAHTLAAWLLPRAVELTYTAWDLQPFARDCGYDGPPFRWDEERRFLLRCELDAAFFHLYGIARDDVDYILETFPIVKRKDVAAYGEYRTKRVILEVYDAMQRAIETGRPYQTLLDPPPADPRVAHPRPGAAAGR